MPTTVFWTNPAGGDWGVPSNWSTGNVPGPLDDAVIDQPGATVTVTHGTGADTVHSLTSHNNIVLSGGSLLLGSDSEASRVFALLGGTLGGTGTLTVDDSLVWTGGTMTGPGRTVAAGGLTISGSTPKGLDGRTLDNAGRAVWLDGGVSAANGAVVHNLPGASFDVAADDVFATGPGS